MKKLKLNSKSLLGGDFPAVLDLAAHDLNYPCFCNFEGELRRAEKQGRPPRPTVHIANNKTVEVIVLSPAYEEGGPDYVVLQDLPNLRELHVPSGTCLQWLICIDLPKLAKIQIDNEAIVWLQFMNLQSLEILDLSRCKRLDHLSISGAPSLNKVNVSGCKKLRCVVDMDQPDQTTLGISRQIQKNQKLSRRDGCIYDDMTFTDLDIVSKSINEGYMLALAKGFIDDGRDEEERAQTLKRLNVFQVKLLRPLEEVTTGGTGRTYAYDARQVWHDGDAHYSQGCGTPEDCLEDHLDFLIANEWTRLPRRKMVTPENVLQFMHEAVFPGALKSASKKTPLRTKTTVTGIGRKPKPIAATVVNRFRPMYPNAALGAVIGFDPVVGIVAMEKFWMYVKQNQLQATENNRLINADENLKAVFGKSQVSMFDVPDILSRNLQTVSARPKAKPNKLKSRNGDQSV